MSYVQGGLIEAIDINSFTERVLHVYGIGFGNYGYGQTNITLPTVAVGELVKSVEWTNTSNAIDVCATHQGTITDIPPVDELEVGDSIKAHPPATGDFDGAITVIDANRLTADSASMSSSNKTNNTRTTAWTFVRSVVKMTYGSGNEARHFFNSGGEIKLQFARWGGTSNSVNTHWTNLLSDIGTVSFKHSSTSSNGSAGSGTNNGYYDLTTSWKTIFSASSSANDTGYDGHLAPYNCGDPANDWPWHNGSFRGPYCHWECGDPDDASFNPPKSGDGICYHWWRTPVNGNNNIVQINWENSLRASIPTSQILWVDGQQIINDAHNPLRAYHKTPCSNLKFSDSNDTWYAARTVVRTSFTISASVKVQARSLALDVDGNGDKGNIIEIRVEMSNTSSGTGGVTSVDGTLRQKVNEFKATTPLIISSPVYLVRDVL